MRSEKTPLRSFPTLGTTTWVSQNDVSSGLAFGAYWDTPIPSWMPSFSLGRESSSQQVTFQDQAPPSSRDPDATASMCVGAWTGNPHNQKTLSIPHLSFLLKGMKVESRAVPAASCPHRDRSLSQKKNARPQGALLPHLWALRSEPAPCGLRHHSPSHLAPPFSFGATPCLTSLLSPPPQVCLLPIPQSPVKHSLGCLG